MNLNDAVRSGAALAALGIAALALPGRPMRAQDASQPAQPAAASPSPADATPTASATLSSDDAKSHKKQRKEDRTVQSKDTRKDVKKTAKTNQIETMDAKLPDKALYDKAEDAVKHGRFDVGRLDLQTLLNTYPDSQYQMRAKLAIADSWYKEGGTAALTQAEQEYKDFITFFPNAPEAAEAQMRVGDIYFRQMDKPDRDYTKTLAAEQEYRLMLQQFPDSPLVPQARQRLREVQEVLAGRETTIGNFYASHNNWPASIARFQTVIDTYPLYSHMDEVLIQLGDAYAAEARFVRGLNLPEAGKSRLEKVYDDEAAAAYRKVVLEHAAAPHVEDARDRLVGMGLPVPTPSKEQTEASVALENSRGQYTLSKRATLLFLRHADTVPAATIGEPPLADASPVLAPSIVRQSVSEFNEAMNPGSVPHAGQALPAAPANTAETPAATAPVGFGEVRTGEGDTNPAPVSAATSSDGSAGTTVGAELVTPSGSSAPVKGSTTFPGDSAPSPANGGTNANGMPTPDPMGGVQAVGPNNNTALAPVEKPTAAPEAINEVTPGSQPAAQTSSPDGKKNPKPAFDKNDESSSKHKKKKGLDKLNPF